MPFRRIVKSRKEWMGTNGSRPCYIQVGFPPLRLIHRLSPKECRRSVLWVLGCDHSPRLKPRDMDPWPLRDWERIAALPSSRAPYRHSEHPTVIPSVYRHSER
jgi:hypothetical protein